MKRPPKVFLIFDPVAINLSSGGVSISPSTVNQISNFKVYAIISTTIPANGSIELIFPQGITTQPSTSCTFTSPLSVTATCTYSLTSNNLIKLTAKVSAQIIEYFELNLPNFKNPSTTSKTSSFQLYTKDESGNVLDSQTDLITLNATTDSLISLAMSSSSKRVGETNQNLTISFQTTNPIPSNGKIYVTFPIWNPQASGTIHALQSYLGSTSNVQCVGITNLGSSPSCTFDTESQTLTLSNGFSSAISSFTQISFLIRNFKNPITTQIIQDFVVKTGDAIDGFIDQSSTFLKNDEAGIISTSSVRVDSTTVQEATRYRVEFMVPVPLNTGCTVEIQFPSQIPLQQGILTLVQSFGLPSTQRNISGTIDSTKNSYIIQNACPTYRDNSNTAIVYFTNIFNPSYVVTTNSIEVFIYDLNNQMICSTNFNGPKLTTTSGSLNVQSLVSSDQRITEINQLANLTFSIQPLHSADANAQIVIYLPQGEMRVPTSSSCKVSGLSSSAVCLSEPAFNRITISQALTRSYTYSSSRYITFKIDNIQLPPSVQPTSGYSFEFYTYYETQYYLVDQANASALFTATQGYLIQAIVTPQSYLALDVSSYTFEIYTKNQILQGGYITIELPPELKISSPNQASCSNFVNINSGASCTFTSSKITLKNGFTTSAQSDVTLPLTFTVSGIQNPRSLLITSSFSIETYSSTDYLIDAKYDQMTVQMKETNPITLASVTPNQLSVGASSVYTFQVKSPTPLVSGDVIYIDFPPELSDTLSNTLRSCNGTSKMSRSLNCEINGPLGLKLTTFFTSTMQANEAFSFTVSLVKNPSSTSPTSAFSLSIYDSKNYLVNQMNDGLSSTFKVQMSTGALFREISVTHQSSRAFQMTVFEFTFKLENTLPANGQVQIRYPSQITVNEEYFACSISNLQQSPPCVLNNKTQMITLTQVTPMDIAAGTVLTVTLYGLINSQYAKETDSFQLYTLTQDGFFINYAFRDLTVTNDCDYPCLTCNQNSTSYCTSCDIQNVKNIILNGQCLDTCPTGYYAANFQCQKCDASCLQCKDGPKQCSQCANGFFLQVDTCVSSCTPDKYIQLSRSNLCSPCSYPCGTCSGNVNNCTSCLENIDAKYFYQGSCITRCPANTTVPVGNTCQNCNSNCKTCSSLPSLCSTCNSPQKLDKLDFTCKNTCPTGTTVDKGEYCEPCESTCKTCASTDTSYCLTCSFGLSLFERNHQCIQTCPEGTVSISENVGRVCKDCKEGCSSCQTSTDYCTKCDDSKGYLFYEFTCVKDKCPSGYMRLSADRNICVRDGERCDYGYEFNDYGKCELAVQECPDGYKLNALKTMCIPVPGGYVPIIFLISCAAWTIFIVKKYRKQFSPIQIITQLLIFYTTLQTFVYIVMFGLALSLNYMLIESIHVITFISMFFLNVIFTLLFDFKFRKKDVAFRHWLSIYKKYYIGFKVISFFYSFKTLRILYSGLFNKLEFNASFDTPYKTIVRPMFYCTVANFVLQVTPVIVMNIYNFWFIEWGYQIMVMGIDNTIIAVVIFILEIIEFRHYLKQAVDEGQHFKMQRSLINDKGFKKEENVMSVMDDSSLALKQGMEVDKSMISVNTKHPNLDFLNAEQRKKLKQPQESEAAVLEKIIRKLNEGQKFNRIFEDDQENQQSQGYETDQHDLEKNQQQKLDIQTTDPRFKPDKKQIFDTTREKLENRLSFRQPPPPKPIIDNIKVSVEQHMEKPLFTGVTSVPHEEILVGQLITKKVGIQVKIENVNEATQPLNIQEINQEVNLESARTEKFNYNQAQQQNLQTPNEKVVASTVRSKKSENQLPKFPIEVPEEKLEYGLHDLNFDNPAQNQEEYEKFYEEIKAKQDKEEPDYHIEDRDWHSYDDDVMRDHYDYMELESDFNESDVSHESYPHRPKLLKCAEYLARLEVFRERIKSTYQYNNCYTQKNDPLLKNNMIKPANSRTRRTQTYERDIAIGYDPFAKDDTLIQQIEDEHQAEIEEDYIGNLILDVIEQITDEDSFIEQQKNAPPPEEDSDSDFDFEKIKQSKKRKREIQFDLDDIMGMFDIDDFGNIQLNTETMRDNLNRKVNKHGYLIDALRNIINQDGEIIFEYDELDADEEIPMPYRFEKRKKQLLKQAEKFNQIQSEKNFDLESILQGEDDKIEQEFAKLKDMSRPESLDSLIGELPIKQDMYGSNDVKTIDNVQPKSDNESDDGRQTSKISLKEQREQALAKAYGGKPPKQKKKSRKRKLDNSGERQPTDRVFSYLGQEEDRIKRMAAISYGLQNNNNQSQRNRDQTSSGNEFEQFFKDQMTGLQQMRQNAKEEFKNQQQSPSQNDINFYADKQGQRLDSATTERSIKNIWNQNPQQQDFSSVSDPLQELIQQDADKANKFFEKINRNMKNASVLSFNQNSKPPQNKSEMHGRMKTTTTSQYNILQNQTMVSNYPQSVASIGHHQTQPIHQEQTEELTSVAENTTYQPPQPFNQQRKFDFYLPNSNNNMQAKLKRNISNGKQGRDISFSEVGEQIYNTSKMKGLERVYLQKYPAQNKPSITNNPLFSGNKKKQGGTFRSNTIGENSSNNPQFRKTQTFQLGQDLTENNTMPFNYPNQHLSGQGGINEDGFSNNDEQPVTVFDGVSKVLSKIDRLQDQKKAQSLSNQGFFRFEERQNNNWM